MPYPNEHSARLRNPKDFKKNSFRRIVLPGSKVLLVLGRLKGDITTTAQAYRFPKEYFTPSQARAWLKRHKIIYIKFEKARKTRNAIDNNRFKIPKMKGKRI